MNFSLLFIFFFFIFSACGVKNDPRPPEGSLLPSIESKYILKQSSNDTSSEEEDPNKKVKN